MATLTGKKIQDTYSNLLQIESGSIQNGLGSNINIPITQISGSTILSGSQQIADEISGSINATSASLAADKADKSNISGSFTITSASLATNKADKASISGSFNTVSASLQNRVALQENFSSSLDTTFATDTSVTTAVSALNLLTSSLATTGSNTFTKNQVITGSLSMTGSLNIYSGKVQIRKTADRYSLRAIGAGRDAIISVQKESDDTTSAKVYADSVQIGVFNSSTITLGNTESVVRMNGTEFDISSSMLVVSSSTHFIGPVTGSISGSFVGNVVGDITGNLTGDVTSHRSYIIPATVSGSAGISTILSSSAYDNVSLVKLDYTGSINGTATVLLPDATATQHTYRSIRFLGNSTITNQKQYTVAPSGSQTLDGGSGGFTMNRSYEGIMVWSDGTEWFQVQAKNV